MTMTIGIGAAGNCADRPVRRATGGKAMPPLIGAGCVSAPVSVTPRGGLEPATRPNRDGGHRSEFLHEEPMIALVVACALAPVLMAPAAAAVGTAAAGFDVDKFSISNSRADLSGRLVWSQSDRRPGTSARLTGRLSSKRGCARVQVAWLNASTNELGSIGRIVCGGGTKRVSLRFRHDALECARVQLFSGGDQTGPARLLCAGGS